MQVCILESVTLYSPALVLVPMLRLDPLALLRVSSKTSPSGEGAWSLHCIEVGCFKARVVIS